eukprot:scaffold99792_cov20-Tisochrysis_lutea.AAC.2
MFWTCFGRGERASFGGGSSFKSTAKRGAKDNKSGALNGTLAQVWDLRGTDIQLACSHGAVNGPR